MVYKIVESPDNEYLVDVPESFNPAHHEAYVTSESASSVIQLWCAIIY